MAEVSIDLNMVRVTNDIFVNKAEACAPELHEDSGIDLLLLWIL
ncbi:MAG: hypothetical protein ACLVG6_00190 [Dorea formicigenerans]